MTPPEDPTLVNVKSIHRLTSIAIKTNLPGNEEFFFIRSDMTSDSLKILISQFVEALNELRLKMIDTLPNCIKKGYDSYWEQQKSPEFKRSSPTAKADLNNKIRYIKDLLSLRIYSYNGERYDMNMILGPLVDNFSKNKKAFGKMKTVKRGTGIMEIKEGVEFDCTRLTFDFCLFPA